MIGYSNIRRDVIEVPSSTYGLVQQNEPFGVVLIFTFSLKPIDWVTTFVGSLLMLLKLLHQL